jgi:ATP phosphoribosyltransferase regulatory subunit HisZ
MNGSLNKWMQQIPEGVQDTLPDECYYRRKIENQLRNGFI